MVLIETACAPASVTWGAGRSQGTGSRRSGLDGQAVASCSDESNQEVSAHGSAYRFTCADGCRSGDHPGFSPNLKCDGWPQARDQVHVLAAVEVFISTWDRLRYSSQDRRLPMELGSWGCARDAYFHNHQRGGRGFPIYRCFSPTVDPEHVARCQRDLIADVEVVRGTGSLEQ